MRFLAINLLLLLSFPAWCQLKIHENSKNSLTGSESDIRRFIIKNHLDYALIAWFSSPWVNNDRTFYCFIHQNKNWYLAQISRKVLPQNQVTLTIQQKKLNINEVASVLNQIHPEEIFKYKQNDFDQLPESCQYSENGEHKGLLAVHDASTYHLMKLDRKEITTLTFYAPNSYLNNCYPHFQKFGILKAFVNAVNQMPIITKNLKD